MVCRIALGDVLQFELFVDIDQHGSFESIVQSGAANLVRLKDDVSVGENYRSCVLLDTIHDLKRIRKQTFVEGIFQEEMRDCKDVQVAGVVCAVTLQGAEVICVLNFC